MASDVYSNYAQQHLLNSTSAAEQRKKVNRFMRRYGPLLPPDRNAAILEIGPGLGEIGTHLTHRTGYANYEGMDVSDDCVRYCAEVQRLRVSKVDNVAEALDARVNAFDLVVLIQVLEHVPKAGVIPLLSAVRLSLKPGGKALIEVPNVSNILVGPSYRYTDFTHEVGYTHGSLCQVLSMSGFARFDVRPVMPTRESFFHWAQYVAQAAMNGLQSLLVRIYIPGTRDLYSPAIYAVASADPAGTACV